jgi:hypothetical protein
MKTCRRSSSCSSRRSGGSPRSSTPISNRWRHHANPFGRSPAWVSVDGSASWACGCGGDGGSPEAAAAGALVCRQRSRPGADHRSPWRVTRSEADDDEPDEPSDRLAIVFRVEEAEHKRTGEGRGEQGPHVRTYGEHACSTQDRHEMAKTSLAQDASRAIASNTQCQDQPRFLGDAAGRQAAGRAVLRVGHHLHRAPPGRRSRPPPIGSAALPTPSARSDPQGTRSANRARHEACGEEAPHSA